MAGNPLVDQGSLNRIKASITWDNFPELNITASFLGVDGISMALEGGAVDFIGTMTGAVTSPVPYLMLNLTGHLLKTQALSDAYKTQMELDSRLGKGTIRPDVSLGLSAYDIFNAAIEGVRELSFAGRDHGWVINFRGYYLINSVLFD